MFALLLLYVLIALAKAQDNSSSLRLLQSQFIAPTTASSCFINVGWQFTSGYGSSSGNLQCGNLVCRGYFGSSSISFNGPGGTATSNYPLSKVDSGVLCPCFTDYDCYYTWTSYGSPASLQPKCLGVDQSNGLPGTCGQGTAVTTSTPTVTVASGCPLSNPCGSSCSIATCNSGCGGNTLLSTTYGSPSTTLTMQGCQCSSNSDCSNSFWGSLPTRVCSEGFCRAVAKTTSTAVCVTQTAVLPPPGSRLNCYLGDTSSGTVVTPTLSTSSAYSFCGFFSYVCDGTPNYPCTTKTGSTTVATGLAVGTTIYEYFGSQTPFFASVRLRSPPLSTSFSNIQICATSGCNTPLSSYSSSSLPCTSSSLPYSCSAGQYNTNAGPTSSSCSTCGANTYSQGGATTCTACPSGTTSSQGSTSSSACLSASTCSSCVASFGYWCPSSTSSTSGVCASSSSYSCFYGLVSTSTSCGTYPSLNTCSTCAGGPGYWCSSNSKCATASSSSTCPELTIGSSSNCPGSQGEGSSGGGPSSDSCSGLSSGSCNCSLSLTYNSQYYQTSCSYVACTSCRPSGGIPSNTALCACNYICNPGQYNANVLNGGPTSASCSICPENTYSSYGAISCTACPSGTTSSQGSTSSSACTTVGYPGGGPANSGASSSSDRCSGLSSGSCACSLSISSYGYSASASCNNVACNSCDSAGSASYPGVSVSCSCKLGPGPIAGIVVGAVVLLIIICVAVYFCRRSASAKSLTSTPGSTAPSPAGTPLQTYNNPASNYNPSIQAYQAPQAYPAAQPYPAAAQPYPTPQPYPSSNSSVTWTSSTDGKNNWYVSTTGETSWTLPPGAILRPT